MRPHWLVLGSIACCALAAMPAASAPLTAVELAIQGVARDPDDVLIPTGNVAVRVFADSLGGSALYNSSGEFNGAISSGIFDIVVGKVTPLMLDHDLSYFLELDVAGVEVAGDAAGGRLRFFPGGGSHARPDLEARLSLLETAMGLSPQNAGSGPASRDAQVPASSRRSPGASSIAPLRITSTFSNQYALLGFGVVSGSAGGLTATAQLLAQPVGLRASGVVQAQFGPYFLFTPMPNPTIRFVHDVPGDQGRAVRIRWRNDQRERPFVASDTLPHITSYTVYRRVEAGQGPMSRVAPGRDAILSLPPGEWDVLTTIPATLDTTYQTVVATLCDSNSAGMCESAFMVRSITDRLGLYHNSVVDTGYSVDNLAPGVPQGLTVQAATGGTQLSWQSSAAPDFQYFRVYRSTDPEFTPGPGNFIHATATPGWLDPLHGAFTYRVTAVDFNGNESPPASVTVVAGAERFVPRTLAFLAMVPNPFHQQLSMVIDVPVGSGHVQLSVFDVMGRHIRTLADTPLAAGRYSFAWDGRSDSGERAPSGVYVARLSSAGRMLTRRATLLP